MLCSMSCSGNDIVGYMLPTVHRVPSVHGRASTLDNTSVVTSVKGMPCHSGMISVLKRMNGIVAHIRRGLPEDNDMHVILHPSTIT